MAAGPRIPGTKGRRSPSGLINTEPLAECKSVTQSTEPDHSSRACVLDSVRERSASASTGCSDLLSGLRPINNEVVITCRRPVSKTSATASDVVVAARPGRDLAKTASSTREPSAIADPGRAGNAGVSGSRPRPRSAVTVRLIHCDVVKPAMILRTPTGLPVRSSTVRTLKARRPSVRPRRMNSSN